MKTYMLIILPVIAVLLTSCSKENELKESVFIYDPENFDLPEYSEWGYNTFGAYYDREIFVSNDEAVPAKITVSDTSLSFLLEGEKRTDDYNSYYNNSNMLLTFTLPGSLPDSLQISPCLMIQSLIWRMLPARFSSQLIP